MIRPFYKHRQINLDNSVISVECTPNSSLIVAGTVAKSVYLMNYDGDNLWEKPKKVDEEVWAVSISKDGQFVAAGTARKKPADGTLYVYTRKGNLFWSTRLRSPIWNCKLSDDGKYLLVSCWANILKIFELKRSEYKLLADIKVPGQAGLYGCDFIDQNGRCVVASYNQGLFIYDFHGRLESQINLNEGIYNISYCAATESVFAGLRTGEFAICNIDTQVVTRSTKVTQRPICGISTSLDGQLVACGSFDGRICCTNALGEILWKDQAKGEIWSTAISSSGSKIVSASGDHSLCYYKNMCPSEALLEVNSLESALGVQKSIIDNSSLTNLLSLYQKYGLFEYGYKKINSIICDHPKYAEFKEHIKLFLVSASTAESSGNQKICFDLGIVLMNERLYKEAIKYFQISAKNPTYRSLSQRMASECFSEMGLKTAASSAERQSRAQFLDADGRQVLFSLARSYEDVGQWAKARKLYETVLSWDMEFRNAHSKLQISQAYEHGTSKNNIKIDEDYTGSTVSLIGPDVPMDVDEKLSSVIEARSKEILIDSAERAFINEIASDLLSDPQYSRGIKRNMSQLDYDQRLFLRYDYGLPEDELKKFLETVNAYKYFLKANKLDNDPTSLDVGSATGRYPSLLNRLGFSSYGMDIEENAIKFANSKKNNSDWPVYFLGDATKVWEKQKYFNEKLTFNLITCMMGTFEHLNFDGQERFIQNAIKFLKPGGFCVVSLWDKECPHLAYLSMYDEVQKDLIHKNSRTQLEMVALLTKHGFTSIQIIPFSLMPHTLIYDLGIERFKWEDVEIATQADLAARALFSEKHGEMFLAIGIKIV